MYVLVVVPLNGRYLLQIRYHIHSHQFDSFHSTCVRGERGQHMFKAQSKLGGCGTGHLVILLFAVIFLPVVLRTGYVHC